jgi:hypothetical protein
MSELVVGSLKGLAANDFKIEVASGSQLVQPGAILQVVQTVKTDTFSTSSSSYVDVTGLSASITPQSTSSKIFVAFTVPVGFSNSGDTDRGVFVAPFRGSTNLLEPSSLGSKSPSLVMWNAAGLTTFARLLFPVHGSILDSPNTASSVTYSIRVRRSSSGTAYVNRPSDPPDNDSGALGVATITLMEVAG